MSRFRPALQTPPVDFGLNIGSGLRQWRAAKARLDAGSQELVTVNFLGDSITEGGMSGGGAAIGSPTSYETNGYVGRIRDALKAIYGDTGWGYIPNYYPNGAPYWTFTGSWTTITNYGPVHQCEQSTANGDTASITFTGTGIGVVVVSGSGAGAFSITIDGGTPTDLTANSSTLTPAKAYEVTGLTAGSHTAVITNTDTGGKSLFLQGAYPIVNTVGVRCNMLGRWGTTASQAVGDTGTGYTMFAEIDVFSPILTVIAYTANDYSAQTSLSSYESSLQSLITRAQGFGDVLLFANGIRNDLTNPGIPQYKYVDVVKGLALTNGCAFVNLFERWSGDASYVENTLGYYAQTQNVHPNDWGHQDMATALLHVLLESA